MWMIWILMIMTSIAGYYSLSDQISSPPPESMKSADLAGSMAIYRAAVLRYATANPSFTGTVADSNLSFPTWYRPLSPPLWTNYIAADGTIVIYASSLPPMTITSEIVSLSRNSVLAGQANAATHTLDSPVFGNNQIPLPAGLSIPNGSPVWLAKRN
jgi:hypothetical protein